MNHLKSAKSPYLQQHKNNPVDWYPWGEEAFSKAKQENKPIFLSIGYSTCHWCHVMARESFEDAQVAEVLNKNYVSIKLDREERPDIDEIYMTALLALSGSGGWPLSAWLTPDAKPFFAGTYFPKPQFLSLCNRIGELWRNENASLKGDAEKFTNVIAQNFSGPEAKAAELKPLLVQLDADYEAHFDEANGGFKGAPKFPQTFALMALMQAERLIGSTRTREMVHHTLSGMINGGLFDHVEGGFHRYSVDARWAVPHFEKMLYDQAWISLTLFEASQFLNEPWFANIGERTLKFVSEQLRHPDGGFYSALDAESVVPETGKKQEGHYFTFAEADAKAVLSPGEMKELEACPILDGRYVLQKTAIAPEKLRPLRDKLPRPARDEKIITSWNAWMIQAFCKGFEVSGDERYVRNAQDAWQFIAKNMRSGGRLARRWCDGDSSITATAEDYAALIGASLALYNSTLEHSYLDESVKLQQIMNELFWDKNQSGYMMSDTSDPHLLIRFQQNREGVTPSVNSQSYDNLVRLHFLTTQPNLEPFIEALKPAIAARLTESPLGFSYGAVALMTDETKTKIIVKKHEPALRAALKTVYKPALLLHADAMSPHGFVVCSSDKCLPGVESASDALAVMQRL